MTIIASAPSRAYDPRDVADLTETLRVVRDRFPDATGVLFDAFDEGDRGYRVVDVELRHHELLSAADADALADLDDAVYHLSSNLAWRGVLGSSKYGCSRVPIDWHAPTSAPVDAAQV